MFAAILYPPSDRAHLEGAQVVGALYRTRAGARAALEELMWEVQQRDLPVSGYVAEVSDGIITSVKKE